MTRSDTAFTWPSMTIKAQLQAIFSAYQTHHDFSGVALVKTETDVLHAGAYGYASRPWRIANTLHTRFDTASITKLFTMRCVATELGGT